MDKKYDALGNEIIIGNIYGMSRNSNGNTTIYIGTAIKLTQTKVTLEIIKLMRCLYSGEPCEYETITPKVSVLSTALFPVTIKYD